VAYRLGPIRNHEVGHRDAVHVVLHDRAVPAVQHAQPRPAELGIREHGNVHREMHLTREPAGYLGRVPRGDVSLAECLGVVLRDRREGIGMRIAQHSVDGERTREANHEHGRGSEPPGATVPT
jgi:hypothetical protein